MVQVEINGKSLYLDFSLKFMRALGRKWGHKTMNETLIKIDEVNKISEMDLDAFDLFYEILEMAINKCSANEHKITIDELEDLPIDQLTALSSKMTEGITEGFMIDNPKEEKKPKALKK